MKDVPAERLEQAAAAVEAGRRDLSAEAPAFAVERAYYAMFYAVDGLLAAKDLRFSSHRSVHAAFGREFARTGALDPKYHRWLLDGFDARQEATYEVRPDLAPEDAEEALRRAEELLVAAREYLEGSA